MSKGLPAARAARDWFRRPFVGTRRFFVTVATAVLVGVLVSLLSAWLLGLMSDDHPRSPEVIVDVAASMFNPPGYDSPSEEYVCIRNEEGRSVNMVGWELSDAQHQHTYVFPNLTLAAGKSVRVFTGRGKNTETVLYWNRGAPVWNNNVEIVRLVDRDGTVIDVQEFGVRPDKDAVSACG